MKKKNKVCAVLGSSWLVGSFIIKNLSPHSLKVYSFSRKDIDFEYENVENIIIDFDNINNEKLFLGIDDLYIALGTTIKKAGTSKEFEKIDFHYCYSLAKHAYDCGVKRVSIVSSAGSNPKSKFLYPRVKGRMEGELKKIKFQCVSIAKPGIILGKRKETRFGELIGKFIFKLLDPFLLGRLSNYKSIHAETIAKAMIHSLSGEQNGIFELHFKELVQHSIKFNNL